MDRNDSYGFGPSPAAEYVSGVLAGAIEVCDLVKRCVRRHVDDLDSADSRGLYFDLIAAADAAEFFPTLKHFEGEWAGQPFELAPWEDFIIRSLFGWKKTANGYRRFRTAYIEIPRKNGKSLLASGVGVYLFMMDDEAGAQVYTAATKEKQARIIHKASIRMVRRSDWAPLVEVRRDNMNIEATASLYEPLGADAGTLDGLGVHGALVDELHAHRTRDLWDVLDTATGARRQAMLFAITTAGTDRESICYLEHEYSDQVLRGVTEDDTRFCYISTIDEDDRENWYDEGVWRKANPNFSILNLDDMRALANKAKAQPASLNSFLRLRLNVWTQQSTRWIDMDLWLEQGGTIDEAALEGRDCFGGLDLSSVSDLTAACYVFPHDDDPEAIDVLWRAWCPEARLTDKQNRYRSSYQVWARQGYLTTTEGDAIDYGFVKAQILADAEKFHLMELNIDRLFQGQQLAMELEDELAGRTEVFAMNQGIMAMTPVMREFERRLRNKKIHHGNNPIARFCADNVAVKMDANENIKPDKASSQGKIDLITALLGGLDRLNRAVVARPSAYEDGNWNFGGSS